MQQVGRADARVFSSLAVSHCLTSLFVVPQCSAAAYLKSCSEAVDKASVGMACTVSSLLVQVGQR
jgi:hypothetical protein